MKNGIFGVFAILVAALAVVAYSSLYTIYPTQQALVVQFGEVRRPVTEPGLYFKWPFIQDVIFIDKRILNLDMPSVEAIASDKKRLVVDAFARYKIADPVRFYQTVNNVTQAEARLSTFLQSSLRSELARATFTDVVRDKRAELMEQIRNQIDGSASEIGIDLVDVKIRHADLPEANSQAIFRRMQTERQREATEIRAQGEEQSRRIKSRADRDATVLVAEARRDAEKLRGDGDAERNNIFADAYGRDPEFFAFYRSMQAYETGLNAGDTSLVISPDSAFFRFFNDPMGREGAGSNSSSAPAGSAAPAQ
ncbi:protease modulator HflC [Breoghania sp. L-A4]|uniref:protease modulator HflC n=1 Tax=Breoghania sp. L-A4 TaxID=2304600 RepID=UPI000E358506|nr:protease modulator HflC [Breoghania sp. L-A4]AXS41303.1 protease modulator HflC [Breoghania sp. L-A4]